MSSELPCQRVEREAVERLVEIMSRPIPKDADHVGVEGMFDPWDIMDCVFGSYCSDFDKCAIEVLTEIQNQTDARNRRDLGARMFREMLCYLDLCDYGMSPRVCFATRGFREHLPRLITMWCEWSKIAWGRDVHATICSNCGAGIDEIEPIL